MTFQTFTPPAEDARLFTVSEVLALTGAKYRFVDYAIRSGYLGNDTANGSGSRRMFTETEADVIYAAVSLIAAGFTVSAAFDIARAVVSEDRYRVQVGSIYALEVTLRDTSSEVAKPEVPNSEEPPA